LEDKFISADLLQLYTDASGSLGYGAVFQQSWFYGEWDENWEDVNITVKELYPIVLGIDLNLDTCKRERTSLITLHRPSKWVDLNKIVKDKDNNTNRLTRYIIYVFSWKISLFLPIYCSCILTHPAV
jgi:hypothetical protein